MTTLIVPAAGLSTRYGLSRPKFLLQHPLGTTMLTAGLKGFAGVGIDEVLVVSLADYFSDISTTRISEEIEEAIGIKVRWHLLDAPTSSMVATICRGIEQMPTDEPIILKDTDNSIAGPFSDNLGSSFICYANLDTFRNVAAAGKSFVELGTDDAVTGIVEKRIVSGLINTGVVGFESASLFYSAAAQVSAASELYVSDVVRYLLDEQRDFRGIAATAYEDWGTLREWTAYCRTFATVFVDIDGVTAHNENPYSMTGGWERFRPLDENVALLLQLSKSGRVKLVFSTSRARNFRDQLDRDLRATGFDDFELVMGLPHAQRIVVNDFAPTNPYPSALAVNLTRNSTELAAQLGSLIPGA